MIGATCSNMKRREMKNFMQCLYMIHLQLCMYKEVERGATPLCQLTDSSAISVGLTVAGQERNRENYFNDRTMSFSGPAHSVASQPITTKI